MKQNLIIIRGAPASGKTTLGKNLRNLEERIVWVQVDGFKRFFAENSEAALDEVNRTALIVLTYLLDKGYSVVFDGIFKNPDYVYKAIEIAKSRNIKVTVYELTCSLETLLERDKTREGVNEGHRIPMEKSVIESIYNKLEETPIKGSVKLDTDNQSFEQCLEVIRTNWV